MNKIFSILLLSLCLNAKDYLYTHIPGFLPTKEVNTSFGKELINLINNSEDEIRFAVYGLRGQDDILQALLNAQKRGVNVKGVVDSDSHGKNYYSDTYKLYEYFDIKSDHKSYIMHNKFFVFDKKIIWSGSSNISDTGTGGYNANNSMVIENKTILEWGKIFLSLSRKGLEKRSIKNDAGKDESIFLRSVENILANEKTKAEITIEKFQKNKNLDFLYEKKE